MPVVQVWLQVSRLAVLARSLLLKTAHVLGFESPSGPPDDRVVFEWLPRSKARKVRFASDSPLEEAGFEPLVPGDGEVSWALSHSMSGGV